MKYRVLCLTGLLATSLLAGCNSTPAAETRPPRPAAAKAVRYVCPMGCAGSESPKPGHCPVCDMVLEKKG